MDCALGAGTLAYSSGRATTGKVGDGEAGVFSTAPGSQGRGAMSGRAGAPRESRWRSQVATEREIGEAYGRRKEEATASRPQLVEAMERVICRRGYDGCMVTDVAAAAGASPGSFQMHFSNKGECLVALHKALVNRALRAVWQSWEAKRSWPERTISGLEVVVGMCVTEPRLARAALVEVNRAGVEGWRAYLESLGKFAELVEPDQERARALPERAALMAVSGVAGLIGEELERGEAAGLAGLVPELGRALLAPLIGPVAAAEEIARLGVRAAG